MGIQSYIKRVVDRELESRLGSAGAVVIEGPKASGKTTTARQWAASEVLLDVDEAARRAAAVDPSLVLEGPTPRLIDEWQVEPTLWNHIRRAVDERKLPGQFLLSGSAVPADDITRHTGAGRIARVRLRPMSLFESGHSSGEISLAALLDRGPVRSSDTGLTISDLADRVAVGGWPAFQRLSVPQALRAVTDYLDEIRRTDINRMDGTRRDPERVGRVLRALARNSATPVAFTTLAADAGGADGPLDRDTVSDYVDALARLMIIENQPAWAPHLRSRSQPRTAPTRHFVDPSLAVAALGASPERLLIDLNVFGLLYESLVVRDLRIYAQAIGGDVYHYRDNTGLEVDAIVQTRDGRWGAFEIKLGGRLVEEAATTLLKFAERVDTKRVGDPRLLAVISGTGYGFRREDNVAVIPVGALRP